MTKHYTTTIESGSYNTADINYLSDMIRKILREKHGRNVGSLWFGIGVSYTLEDEEDAA